MYVVHGLQNNKSGHPDRRENNQAWHARVRPTEQHAVRTRADRAASREHDPPVAPEPQLVYSRDESAATVLGKDPRHFHSYNER